jgi:hypothetical protein
VGATTPVSALADKQAFGLFFGAHLGVAYCSKHFRCRSITTRLCTEQETGKSLEIVVAVAEDTKMAGEKLLESFFLLF